MHATQADSFGPSNACHHLAAENAGPNMNFLEAAQVNGIVRGLLISTCQKQKSHQILALLKSYLLLAGGGLAGGGGLLPVVGGLTGLA